MGLSDVFKSVSDFFESRHLDYAVIGAFALYGYGYVRATRDIDFVTRIGNQSAIKQFLDTLGFETTHCSSAFSNHIHPVGSLAVDIMYVDGTTADDIFAATNRKLIFKDVVVPIVSAEHLIAMKLFAAGSSPQRKLKDLADVRELIKNAAVDMAFVKKCFIKNGLEAYYDDTVG